MAENNNNGFYAQIAGALLSGISNSSKERSGRKSSKEERRHEREQTILGARLQGDESRRTLEFASKQEDFMRKKQRKETSDAWDGYFGPKTVHNDNVAPSLDSYLGMDPAMMQYDFNPEDLRRKK